MTTVTLDLPEHLASVITELGDRLPLVLEMGVSRLAPISTKAYREAIDFLTQDPTPEMVVAFRFTEDIETRINELLTKNSADQLSLAEEIELDRIGQLDERMQLIKARARVELAGR